MIVMRIAITPSLNASSRVLLIERSLEQVTIERRGRRGRKVKTRISLRPSRPLRSTAGRAPGNIASEDAPGRLLLGHRLDPQSLRQLIESRQIRRQRALQAIGLAFQLRPEIVEDRRRVPERPAVAGRNRAEQRREAIVRLDWKVQRILVALIANLIDVFLDGAQFLRE